MARITTGDDYFEEFPNQFALNEANHVRALKGKRGQAVLREIREALLSMPVKRLITSRFAADGEVCVLGALNVKRLIDKGVERAEALRLTEKEYGDYEDAEESAEIAGDRMKIGFCVAWDAMYQNDEAGNPNQTPEQRYERVLRWVQRNISEEPACKTEGA